MFSGAFLEKPVFHFRPSEASFFLGDVSCLMAVGKSKLVVGNSHVVVGKSKTRALPERALPERVLPERACQREHARESLPERACQRDPAREPCQSEPCQSEPCQSEPFRECASIWGESIPPTVPERELPERARPASSRFSDKYHTPPLGDRSEGIFVVFCFLLYFGGFKTCPMTFLDLL